MKHLTTIREYIRHVIQEEIGRNWRSVETMPMNYTKYPEISVSVDYITEKQKWAVGIKPRDGREDKKQYRYFNSREDAETWARTEADRLRAQIMNMT